MDSSVYETPGKHRKCTGHVHDVFWRGNWMMRWFLGALNKLIKKFNGCLPAGCFPGRIV